MLAISIFFFLELVQFYFFFNNKRRNVIVLSNTIFQVVLCIGAVLFLEIGDYKYEVVLWPLLLFAFLNFISNYPISGRFQIDKSLIRESKLLDVISFVFVIFSIYFLIWKWGDFRGISESGNYLEAYLETHSDDVVYYNTFYEQIIVNYIDYLYLPVLLYGFCCLVLKKYFYGIIVVLSVFFDRYIWATVYSSRTILFAFLVLIVVCSIIFFKSLNKKVGKIFWIIGLFLLFVVMTAIIAISVSRFEGKELSEWIYSYFGRSIITFQDVVYSLNKHSYGSTFFSYIYGLLSIDKERYVIQRDIGSNFIPEFARLYADFNLWFVLFLLLPICVFVRKHFQKAKYHFADLYLILIYFVYLFIGNLYLTIDFIKMFMIVVIYQILKFHDGSFKVGNRYYHKLLQGR